MKLKKLIYKFNFIIFFLFNIAHSQENTYSCKNEAYSFLKQTIGKWHVITKDRTSPNVYENNYGTSIITSSIEGCGIKESYKGVYRNKNYAREVFLTGLDSTNVEMLALDSEHGSFSTLNGSIKNNELTTYWYRNKEVKRLQSKYIMSFTDTNTFEFSSYLSTNHGKDWALTHQRKYYRINYEEVEMKTKDSILVYGDLYTIKKEYPTIILFHQGGSNAKGEYHSIVPKLLNEGYNIMAIDQRVGGSSYYGGYNRTISKLGTNSFTYCDAYTDLEAALDYIIDKKYNGNKILWGSSYGAALAIQLASKREHDISALLAFSPSTGNAVKKCHPNQYINQIGLPFLLLRPKKEMERESSVEQFSIAKEHGHQTYIAEHGTHGSSMLVKDRVGADVNKNWNIVLEFLNKHRN